MDFVIESEKLRVAVTTNGAQIKSVKHKDDEIEHMWSADPSVWGYHAPILFPYSGRLREGRYILNGNEFKNCPAHGFARTSEHTLIFKSQNEIVLELTDSDATKKIWPCKFRLLSSFKVIENRLEHTLTVENTDDSEISFGIGFHPAFAIPFDSSHTYKDYEFRFNKAESPICLKTDSSGLISGQTYYLGENTTTIPITDKTFENDAHCMHKLNSETFGLYEKGSNRAVVCDIKDFPFCLIWSKPGEPKFVCIEPWNSLPDRNDSNFNWEDKPAAAKLLPNESWSTRLTMSFTR